MSNDSKKIYLLDSHGLIYQMFHAIRNGMKAPDGRPTNAVYGVTRELIYIQEEVKPAFLIGIFDTSGPTFRDTIYKEYKQHREPPPDDLILQIPIIQQIMKAMGIPVLEQTGYEADDIIATLARLGIENQNGKTEVIICSSDKDCRQLISDHVQIYNLKRRDFFNRQSLFEEWGITPEQVVDYQTLVGDSVDNVPGIKGIGAKTATKLLQQFGSIEKMIENQAKLTPPKIKENFQLAVQDGSLERTRKLVRLETHVPIKFELESWNNPEWRSDELLTIFQTLGFRTFSEKVRTFQRKLDKNSSLISKDGQVPAATAKHSENPENGSKQHKSSLKTQSDRESESLFADLEEVSSDGESLRTSRISADWHMQYQLVQSKEVFQEFLIELKKQNRFALDLETTGLNVIESAIVGMAFCWQENTGYYLALQGPPREKVLSLEETMKKLKPILENEEKKKINQNIKFDRTILRSHGIELRGVDGDSMLAHYLLHAGERGHNLDDLTAKYLHHEMIPITDLIGANKKQQKLMNEVPLADISTYAGEDADAAWRLTHLLEKELQENSLWTLYQEIEIPLVEVLSEMEWHGIRLDVAFLKQLSLEMEKQLKSIESDIYEIAEHKFNIASPKQLREVLFDELKLPVQQRTEKTNEASTDQETLEKLARLDHPKAAIAVKIVEYRQIAKLKGTYVDTLPELVQPKTGRIHTSFNQMITSTGRLSSSQPNLQNIPARTDQGRQIRQAFLPERGWKLVCADYSQIELRFLAHLSGDEALIQAFQENRDIHSSVAAEIFGVTEKAVTSEMRRVAKTVNFGVIYGMSAHGLAERLQITRTQAEQFIEQYFARFSRVLDYQDQLLNQARLHGYVRTISERRRRVDPGSLRPNSTFRSRNGAEREAINMEIQGSAADLLKKAMIRIHRKLQSGNWQSRMLLTVHDELVFEAPVGELDQLATMVQKEMTQAMSLKVPLIVDISYGDNWLEVEEWQPKK